MLMQNKTINGDVTCLLQSLQPPVCVFVTLFTFQLRNDPPQLTALQLINTSLQSVPYYQITKRA